MVILGVYSSITFWNELLTLIQAGIGPLLVIVGAFIVWLESDELKMRRQQKQQKQEKERKGVKQFTKARAEKKKSHNKILEGTVDEVKETVRKNPGLDFESLLETEKQGKDRKTVKEFLERRI